MQNGKGSKSRVSDIKKYSSNYDEIDWNNKRQCMFGKETNRPSCPVCIGRGRVEDDKSCEGCGGKGYVSIETFKKLLTL